MLLVYLMHIELFFHSLQIISVLLYILFARAERFELPSKVLETRMLPLHHTRVCDPAATRTRDFFIKSEELYQLSYEVILTFFLHANIIFVSVQFFVIVEMIGYAPIPKDFQSFASTKLASSPSVLRGRFELPTSSVSARYSHH